jgi:hypothetical protein
VSTTIAIGMSSKAGASSVTTTRSNGGTGWSTVSASFQSAPATGNPGRCLLVGVC